MISPRDATNHHLARMGRELDLEFDVDLGELVKGHHVIARGLYRGKEVGVPRWQAEITARLRDPPSGFSYGRRILTDRDLEVVSTRVE